MPLRTSFIGCVELSGTALSKLMTMPDLEIAGVVTRRQSTLNSDFYSLESLACSAGSPVLIADGIGNADIAKFLREQAPEVIFCVGWSHLLKPDVLAVPQIGVVGYHPSLLPRNRGRHPLIWALALGLRETGSTFFLMDSGVDSGPILSQRIISISTLDDASNLYAKITNAAIEQLDELVPALVARSIRPEPQDPSKANAWRKRRREDGRIDWRMSAEAIRNLVRALTRPYVGAHCEVGGKSMVVWKAEIGPAAPENLEPGRVIEVRDSNILVKCYDGSIWLIEHELVPLPQAGSNL